MNKTILGAIVGDMVGYTKEWHNIKTKDFQILPKRNRFTDDTLMTLAVAEWLMKAPSHSTEVLVECMLNICRTHPRSGYGKMFKRWLAKDNPRPYNSFEMGQPCV